MRSLLCLDVSENKIERLPEELGNLPLLTDLLVSQNILDALPESIGKYAHPHLSLKVKKNKKQQKPKRLHMRRFKKNSLCVCRKASEALYIES